MPFLRAPVARFWVATTFWGGRATSRFDGEGFGPGSATWTVTPRCDTQKEVWCDPLHRRGRHRRFARPSERAGARPGIELVSFRALKPHEGCAARSSAVGWTPGCGWSSPPPCSHVCRRLPPSARPCAGRMFVVAPPPQSGITRIMRERAVLGPLLSAGITLSDGCRGRRVRGACLRLVACARDSGVGHGAAAAAPERIIGVRDRLEQPVNTWGGGVAVTTGTAAGAVRIMLSGGWDRLDAGDHAAPPTAPQAGPRPSAPSRSRQRHCRGISRGRWPASLLAKGPWWDSARSGGQGFQVVSGATVSR